MNSQTHAGNEVACISYKDKKKSEEKLIRVLPHPKSQEADLSGDGRQSSCNGLGHSAGDGDSPPKQRLGSSTHGFKKPFAPAHPAFCSQPTPHQAPRFPMDEHRCPGKQLDPEGPETSFLSTEQWVTRVDPSAIQSSNNWGRPRELPPGSGVIGI